jgi:hypothetical protein
VRLLLAQGPIYWLFDRLRSLSMRMTHESRLSEALGDGRRCIETQPLMRRDHETLDLAGN